jgi:glyoxylase-like metal-dependent hydrolase (beta-lactamase superfamily II)
MYKWPKVIIILISVGTLLGACSNNPEQAAVAEVIEVETPVATEYSTNEFPQTSGYTEQPPVVDSAKGYFVDEIADGIYWLSGSHYQTMFFTTGEGVIAIDAPQPIGQSYLEAIQEVTDEPITHVIYSHAHNDHTGAAGMFPPDIEYIAHQDAVDLLSGVPAPTITFEDTYTLEVGNQVLELSYINTYHSVGDIVIHAPRQKVAMVVDLFHPGSAPFAGFGATIDLGAHLQAHDVLIEEYDFNVLIPGHTEILATKAHLETNRAFILSMQEIMLQAIESVPSDEVIQTCIDMTITQWNGILENLEDRVGANCQKMEEYVLSQSAVSDETSAVPTIESTSMPDLTVFPLPERTGPRTQTSGTVPHVQIGVEPVTAVNDELIRRVFALPGVEDRPTIVSLPGARGMWLSDDIALAHPEAIVSGREFAHIHPDGSLHAPLPYERALEAAEKGWGERHPWADEREGWDGFVMLFTPQSMAELDIIFQLIVESYNHVTGQSVQASDFN